MVANNHPHLNFAKTLRLIITAEHCPAPIRRLRPGAVTMDPTGLVPTLTVYILTPEAGEAAVEAAAVCSVHHSIQTLA